MLRSHIVLLILGSYIGVHWAEAGRMSFKVQDVTICAKEEFQCYNRTCVSRTSRCDGIRDCIDGSDEAGCDLFLCRKPKWYRCKHNDKCISASFLCDKHDDCSLGDDEENCVNLEVPHVPVPCGKSEFTCTDKMCIPKDLVCDGVAQCLDASDETMGCTHIEYRCKGFLCKNQHCIKSHNWICDGVDDCGDGSDEENCFAGCTLEHGKFECMDNSTCVKLNQVCDGNEDCSDRSDEGGLCDSQECITMKCPSSEGCKLTPQGAVCLCKAGFFFNQSSRTCEDVNECTRYGLCSQGCENLPGSFRCTCVAKFWLRDDGRTCDMNDSSEALLVFATQQSIDAVYLTSKYQHNVITNLSQLMGVSYDGKYVYWTDITSKMESIERSLFDGTKRELLVTAGINLPEDLALDWLTGNIYFSDSGRMMIAVCTNSGQHCTVVIQDRLHKPRGIALFPQNGTMFYTDWGDKPMIETADMDGNNRKVVIDKDIHWPNGLSLDWPNERLYWVDVKLKKIESIKLDGTARVTVIGDVLKHPFSIALFNDRIYWSDWDTNSIQSCDKFSGKDRKTLVRDRKVYGVHVYHSSIQPTVFHPCAGNFCSHICLLAPNKNYSCACPDGMGLMPDKHSCEATIENQFLLMGIGNYLSVLEVQTFGRHETTHRIDFKFYINRMAFNSITGELFVADNYQKTIFIVNIRLQTALKLIATGIGNITALSFDYLGNNLYWSDSERSTVEVYSLQTQHRSIIQHFIGTEAPVGFTVVPEIGKMFVALRSPYPTLHTHIDCLDMAGRGPHTLIFEEKLSGNGTFQFVVDRDLRSVYWNEVGLGRIEFTSYEGNARHLFREFLRLPVSIAIVGDALFWTCFRSKRLYWSGKHDSKGSKEIVIEKWLSGHFPDEIVLLAGQQLQRFDHPCQRNHMAECSHICVPTGLNRSACVCPTGMIFSSAKNTTCIDAIDCEFKCTSGECLTISKRCNGNMDCADGSDEKGCEANKRSSSAECRLDQFMCVDRSKCIDRQMRCDKNFDCQDRSDENNCERYDPGKGCHENQHACPDGFCIDVNSLCDGFSDCLDGSDEKDCTNLNNEKSNATQCSKQMFRCISGQCIPRWWECDGSPDCADGSDEHASCLKKTQCEKGFTRCTLGHCIDDRLVCDGSDDCGDDSDEMNCKLKERPCVGLEEENPTQFLCPRSGKCLDISVRCNGTSECPNGEDEAECTNCGIHEFQCQSGACIRKEWQCDKEVDCDDGSDEVDCVNGTTRADGQFHVACGDGTFECKPGVCVDMSSVCDGRMDCADGKDEGKGCADACTNNPCEQNCIKTPNGAVCECRFGYILAGNKKSCLDVDECSTYRPCAQICTNTRGSYHCSCHSGFMLRLDKISCKSVGLSRYVLFTSYNQIRKLEVNPPSIRIQFQTSESRITSMDMDVRRKMLYFTAEDSHAIYEHDTVNNTTQVLHNVSQPEHLALDWITGNLYFYDRSESSIKLYSIKQRAQARVLTFSAQVFLKTLVVDPINGFIFFVLMHFVKFKGSHSIVYRAKTDGLHQQILSKAISHITSIQCDMENKLLYLTDLNTKSLKRMDYDGKLIQTVVEKQKLALSHPIGFNLFENHAFILNMASSTVGLCKLYGNYECKLLELHVYNSEQLLVVHESRQPMIDNVCDPHIINCSLVCVPQEFNGKCICHNGEQIHEGITCPQVSNRSLSPLTESHGRSTNELLVHQTTKQQPLTETNIATTALNIFLGLAVVVVLGFLYKRKLHQKFNVSMFIHNPVPSTIDVADGNVSHDVPKPHETVTLIELSRETPPSLITGVPGRPMPTATAAVMDVVL